MYFDNCCLRAQAPAVLPLQQAPAWSDWEQGLELLPEAVHAGQRCGLRRLGAANTPGDQKMVKAGRRVVRREASGQ